VPILQEAFRQARSREQLSSVLHGSRILLHEATVIHEDLQLHFRAAQYIIDQSNAVLVELFPLLGSFENNRQKYDDIGRALSGIIHAGSPSDESGASIQPSCAGDTRAEILLDRLVQTSTEASVISGQHQQLAQRMAQISGWGVAFLQALKNDLNRSLLSQSSCAADVARLETLLGEFATSSVASTHDSDSDDVITEADDHTNYRNLMESMLNADSDRG
jgi:hypothetical protein